MNIDLGAMAPNLRDQTGVDTTAMENLDRDKWEIIRLYLRGYLSRSQRKTCEKRIVLRVADEIRKHASGEKSGERDPSD